jgi:hypothetical protein
MPLLPYLPLSLPLVYAFYKKSMTINIIHHCNSRLSPHRLSLHHWPHPKDIPRIGLCQATTSVLFLFLICDSHQLLSHQPYIFIVIIPLSPLHLSFFHPSAYVGCWWDLRRDFHFFIFALYLPLEHSRVCVVFRLSTWQTWQMCHTW